MPDSHVGQSTPDIEPLDGTCMTCVKGGHGTYLTTASCRNCGWDGELRHSLTHEKRDNRSVRCPRCECRSVDPGDFLLREEVAGGGQS